MSTRFDIVSTIPSGTQLRVLLNSEHISYGEVHAALKEKGIFVGNSDKSATVPLLSATLLTPDNFSRLIECSVSRESRPKVKVLGLELVSTDVDWITPLRETLFTEGFDPISNIGSVEFVSIPEVVIDNINKICISYVINRQDFSKDWLQRELDFNGEIVIERQGNTLKLDFSSTHSSKETETINRKITSRVSNILSNSRLVSSPIPKQITFKSFSNEERVRFFKRLTAGFPPCLSVGNVNDIEISLDDDAPPLPSDPQVEWMNQSVRRLKVDGDRLNDIFLIADEKYYKYYHIQRMNVTFPFKEAANLGECRISFSFSHSGRSDADIASAELTFECVRMSHENAVNAEAKKSISAAIHKALRSLVEEKNEQIISERVPAQAP
jgi:hypothetical protein